MTVRLTGMLIHEHSSGGSEWHIHHSDGQNSTCLRQASRKPAVKHQPLHTLKHGVVLLSGKQCPHCSHRAVCVAANESYLLWLDCLPGQLPSNYYIFLPSTVYLQSLCVLLHLQVTAQEQILSLIPEAMSNKSMMSPNTLLTNAQSGEHVCLRAAFGLRRFRTAAPTVGTDTTSIRSISTEQALAAESTAPSMVSTSLCTEQDVDGEITEEVQQAVKHVW
jgi:hypothetical protein